jgi:hypothetical protein
LEQKNPNALLLGLASVVSERYIVFSILNLWIRGAKISPRVRAAGKRSAVAD